MSDRYPIERLIEERLKLLCLRRSDLARRCGFRNIAKSMRRIEAICKGDLASQGAKMVFDALPIALELDKAVVDAAIQNTSEIISEAIRRSEAAADAARRASFVPHGYLLGTMTRPSSITMYGLSGGPDRWLKIRLDLSRPPLTFAAQARQVVKNTPSVAFHGRTTGFIINYSPDRAVEFDLDANPVACLDRDYAPGNVEIFIGNRNMPDPWLSE